MNKLIIATAGIPTSTKGNLINGIQEVNKLGLEGMELEFVRGVYLNEEKAAAARAEAEKLGVKFTVHAPYYINLNAQDPAILEASKQRLFLAGKMGFLAGASSVAVHAAYRLKTENKLLFERVEKEMMEVIEKLENEKYPIKISAELSGKHSQFGTIDELLQLSRNKKIGICIDFAHHHAITDGSMTSKESISKLLEKVEKFDSGLLKGLHMHCSGINYSMKGELNHLMFRDKKNTVNGKALMESLKAFNITGQLVVEAPTPEEDAVWLKKIYDSI